MHIIFRVLLISIILAGFYLKIRFNPSLKQQLNFRGDKITIQRDQNSIPHIKSKKSDSILYALGYVFAEDRLFQMHLNRILTSGRISQITGIKTLDLDLFFRQIGFRYWAELTTEKMKNQDPEFYAVLAIFAEGINDYVKQNGLPFEFYLLWINFEDWKVQDCVTIYKLIQWSISNNVQEQYVRSLLLKNYSQQQIKQIFPYQNQNYFLNETNSMTLNDEQIKSINLFQTFDQTKLKISKLLPQRLHGMIEHGVISYLHLFPEIDGSNVWLISGNHTQSGRPFVVADPHFQNSIPTQWYQVQFQTQNNQKFKGFIIAGAPGIAVGKTDNFAWGMTNAKSDIQDLYLQKIEGDKYFFERQWRQLKIRPEIIKVRGQPDTIYNVKSTHRGPILSRLFARGYPYFFNDTLSLIWNGHNSQYGYIKALNNFHRLQTHQDILKISQTQINYGANTNIFFITKDDRLGYAVTGRIPIRSNHRTGAFVKDGTVSEYDWKGFLINYQKPYLKQIQRGYLINSNNKLASKHFKSGIYAYSVNPTARANRLEQLIRNKIDNNVKMTTRDMMDFQLDTVDVYCRQVLPYILERLPQIRVYLNGFSCNFTKDSYQATVYEVFFNHLKKKLKGTNSLPLQSFLIFDHFTYRYLSGQVKHREVDIGLLKAALQQTISFLRATFKDDNPISWKWGKIHRDYLPYRIFSASPLRSLFQRSIDGRGNSHTPNVGSMQKLRDHNYEVNVKANTRTIASFAENSSWWISGTGVSQNIFSEYFTDQLKLYQNDEYIKYEFVNLLTQIDSEL